MTDPQQPRTGRQIPFTRVVLGGRDITPFVTEATIGPGPDPTSPTQESRWSAGGPRRAPQDVPDDLVACALRALDTVDGYHQDVPLDQAVRVMLAAVLTAQAREQRLREIQQVVCPEDRGESPLGWSEPAPAPGPGPGPAELELRGILAADRSRAQIDDLVDRLRTEVTAAADGAAFLRGRADHLDQLDAAIGFPLRRPEHPPVLTAAQMRLAAQFIDDFTRKA